jgi:DNA repair exonuclease SbcCD ATPase subunit
MELTKKLGDVDTEISELNKELKDLAAKRTVALKETDHDPFENVRDAASIRTEIREAQERLEDLGIVRTAIQTKLTALKNNEPKATTVRKEIFGELYPAAVKAYRQLQPHLDAIGGILKELYGVNDAMRDRARQYETLVGERLNPPQIMLPVDPVRGYVAGIPLGAGILDQVASMHLPPIEDREVKK